MVILQIVLGLTSYDVGRIVGSLLLPAGLVWWGVVLRRRESTWWWLPLVGGVVMGLGAIGAAVSVLSPAEEVRSVNLSAVFQPIAGYRFVSLSPEERAQAEEAFKAQAGESARVDVRQVALQDGDVVGVAEAVAVDSDAFDSEEQLLRGVAEGAGESEGITPSPGRLAGLDTYELVIRSGDLAGLTALVWHPPGTNLVVLVFAQPEHVRTIASAMIRTKV